MKIQSTYLRNLRFHERLKQSWVARYLSNPRLLILLILSIISIGVFSFVTLPKVLNPEIKIPIVIVSTPFPGASPQDVESLVTIPLEDAISGVDNVDTVTSSSQNSVSVVQIQFNSGTDPDKARSDVQSAIDSVSLPQNVNSPKVQKLDFENQPIWTFSVTSKSTDIASLIRFSKDLQTKIKDLPSVDNVNTSGIEEQEIQIYIKPETVTTYDLNLQQISQAISSGLQAAPAGSVVTDASTFSIAIDPSITSTQDLRETRINLNGSIVKLGDIAVIAERSKPDQNVSYYATPTSPIRHAITFNVYRNNNVNISTAVSDVQNLLDQELKARHGEFQSQSILNASEEIDTQFNDLTRDFLITIALVFIVLLTFLGIRQALVSLLTIPLTFFISFSVMKFTGISLNFISLFSLLLSLGLLVDDAIVIISAMTAYYRTGKFTPFQTGLLVWKDFLTAIFTTTITTVWAFLPLMLTSGIIGEFIKPIPIVVSTTLLASFFVAMFITLPVIIILLKPEIPNRVITLLKILVGLLLLIIVVLITPKDILFIPTLIIFLIWMFLTYRMRHQIVLSIRNNFQGRSNNRKSQLQARNILNNGLISFERISAKYKQIIGRIISSAHGRRLTIIMVVIFSVFSYILLPLGFVQNEFFPKSDQGTVYVNLELPSGTNLSTSKKEAQILVQDFKTLPGVKFVDAQTSASFSETGAGSNGPNDVLINIVLKDKNERSVTSIDIASIIRKKYANYTKGTLSVVESTGGPPAGADLQIKLFGNDLTTLNTYAQKIMTYLKQQPGVINVDESVKSGTSKIVFTPDPQMLASVGLTSDQVGFWLRTYASGFSVNTARFDPNSNTSEDITIRLNPVTQTPEDIYRVSIPTPTGGVLPLAALGKLKLESNPTLITREDGKRTISVTGGVAKGYSVTTLNQKLGTYADSLNLPDGYSWSTGGVNEQNEESITSILQAMLLSFLLIIVTMVLQFTSFRKALIVMLVIPLSISGVFIIFALTHTPLSFPALIGVLALFGIVVKNSILVVDKIDANLKAGMAFHEAIADGAASRLEAIALTSFCAIVGLIPITLSDPIWRGLGGAIIAGLTFSGTIMLFFIPVVFSYWFTPEEAKRTVKA